jgi:type III pantothenate kinase
MKVLLVIDHGNTRTKAGVFIGGKLSKALIFNRLTAQGFRKLLKQYHPDAILLSAVGKLSKSVLSVLRSESDLMILSKDTLLPIKNKYRTPETLGADRIACAVAAHAFFPKKNVLVIDAGTCIKYDFVDAKGNYHGGSISPGLEMRFNALHHFTAKLPKVNAAHVQSFIGVDTRTSILTGVVQGIVNEVEGFHQLYKRRFGNVKIVLTGGDSHYLSGLLKLSIFATPDLVLHGLYEILQHAKKSK